jgi:hypothetical protein
MVQTFTWGSSGKKYQNPADVDAATLLMPATKIVPLPTDGTAFAPPRKIIGDKAGTATVTDFMGDTIASFPITGQEQNVAVTAIGSLSTTTKVWGLY